MTFLCDKLDVGILVRFRVVVDYADIDKLLDVQEPMGFVFVF